MSDEHRRVAHYTGPGLNNEQISVVRSTPEIDTDIFHIGHPLGAIPKIQDVGRTLLRYKYSDMRYGMELPYAQYDPTTAMLADAAFHDVIIDKRGAVRARYQHATVGSPDTVYDVNDPRVHILGMSDFGMYTTKGSLEQGYTARVQTILSMAANALRQLDIYRIANPPQLNESQ